MAFAFFSEPTFSFAGIPKNAEKAYAAIRKVAKERDAARHEERRLGLIARSLARALSRNGDWYPLKRTGAAGFMGRIDAEEVDKTPDKCL